MCTACIHVCVYMCGSQRFTLRASFNQSPLPLLGQILSQNLELTS